MDVEKEFRKNNVAKQLVFKICSCWTYDIGKEIWIFYKINDEIYEESELPYKLCLDYAVLVDNTDAFDLDYPTIFYSLNNYCPDLNHIKKGNFYFPFARKKKAI